MVFGGAVGSCTALQSVRWRVRFPMRVIEGFHWLNPSGHIMAVGSTQPLTEISTRSISWVEGGRRPVLRADKFAIFMCRWSRNPGSLNLLEPQGLSRPVQG